MPHIGANCAFLEMTNSNLINKNVLYVSKNYILTVVFNILKSTDLEKYITFLLYNLAYI